MNKLSLFKKALANSLGVLVYCGLVGYVMVIGDRIFGKIDNVFGVVAFLMLFVLSTAIVGSLVLAKPIIYYLDGKKKEAISLLLYTIGILFLMTIIILLFFAI